MNAEQTLAAAEVMRRAAEGQPVESKSRCVANDIWRANDRPSWDWTVADFRIADCPRHAPTAHNPDNLTPQQVETHLGWRLLDRDEVLPGKGTPMLKEIEGFSRPRAWEPGFCAADNLITFRTKLTREELAAARGIVTEKPEPRVFTFVGEVMEVGDNDEGQPRVIIATTREEVTGKPIPLYRSATITITEEVG